MQFFSEHYLLGTAQTLTSESAPPPCAESPRKWRQRAGASLSGTPAGPDLAPAPPSCPVCPGESSPCPGPTSPTSTRTCPLGLTPQLQLTPRAGPHEPRGPPPPGRSAGRLLTVGAVLRAGSRGEGWRGGGLPGCADHMVG